MDGRTDGWVDGRMDGRMDGYCDRTIDRGKAVVVLDVYITTEKLSIRQRIHANAVQEPWTDGRTDGYPESDAVLEARL